MKKTWKERAELAESAIKAIRKSLTVKVEITPRYADSYRLGRIEGNLESYDHGIKQ